MTSEDTSTDVLRRTKAALALAHGATTDEAGQTAGVTGRTVRRWREEPAFRAEVTQLRREMLDDVLGQLGGAAVEAVKTLRAALDEQSAGVRVRAASVLLASLLTVREAVDVEERLAALEAAAEQAGAV